MEELTSVDDVRARVRAERGNGRRIGLVPTMGFLHAGHLGLVDAARRVSDCVVMSIFVNPLQFGPNEDFGRYPRDLDRDRELAQSRGVDILFLPTPEVMYGGGVEIRVVGGDLAARLDGAARPGHFDGVLTVVAKLFNIVAPDVACFGQKDVQQLTLVQRMIVDLNFPVRVVVVPTVREPDGVAMSSRNSYLSTAERVAARSLSQALGAVERLWNSGETNADVLRECAEQLLGATPGVVADYVAVVEPGRLVPVTDAVAGTIVAIAARVGTTRLIDNLILTDSSRLHAS